MELGPTGIMFMFFGKAQGFRGPMIFLPSPLTSFKTMAIFYLYFAIFVNTVILK